MKQRYKKVADMMELYKDMEKFVIEHGNPDKINDLRRKYIHDIRKELKSANNYYRDPLEKPMSDSWRTQIDDEYGEDGKDYRILKVEDPDDWTDEEIEEYIMDEVGYPPICSPYDCTGKRFTAWTHWSKQPIGIVMIHSWRLDV